MRVLHLFNEINFSGAEIMYANAAPYFQSLGVEMFAFNTAAEIGNYVDEFEREGIKVFHKPVTVGGIFSVERIRYYVDLYHFLKDYRIDVLHIHYSRLYLAGFFARIANVRTVKTMHNVFKNRWFTYPYGFFQRMFSRKLSKVVFHTIGESVYNNESDYYHNKSIRINNWYDSSRFFPLEDNDEKLKLRKELGIKESAFVLISVGGCSHIKNHIDIIKALNVLKDNSDFVYLHLGTGEQESEEKELVAELGLDDRVFFFGNRNNVRDFLVASDLYLMTSKFEGLSISALEAMASGLPSVLYDSPGLRDLIDNDNNGFLIPYDYNILAEKISFLKDNPEIALQMARNAINFVLSEFSMKENVKKIVGLYHGHNSEY